MQKKALDSSLPPEEWDFRSIESRFLPIAIEYEYLRSSDLADPMRKWLARPYVHSPLARHELSVDTLIKANLITVSDRSPLARFQKLLQAGFPEQGPLDEAWSAAASQIQNTKVFSGTVGEAIGRLFSNIKNIEAIESALLILAGSLPPEVRKRHADRICLRFDRFPEPWVRIAASPNGRDYLERRSHSSLPKGEAMWDLINPLDYADVLETEPLIYLHQFIIDWSRRREDILGAFSNWLNQAHPDSRRGIRSQEGWLKRLSAYRLKRVGGLTYAKAVQVVADRKQLHSGAISDTLPNSQATTEWSRYVSEVEKQLGGDFIREIRESFDDLSGYPPANQPHVPGALFARSLVPHEKKTTRMSTRTRTRKG